MARWLITGAAVLLAGCALEPRPVIIGRARGEGVERPFTPVVLQIHPLTRTGRDEARSQPLIVCHIELRDSWGDTCKGVGDLQVQLFRSDPGGGPGTQELKWDVDLSDLEVNSHLYDPATRTYRLALEVPERLIIREAGRRVRLRAILQTWGPRGEPRTLQDEFVLEP